MNQDIKNQTINKSELSARTFNLLHNAHITNIGDLINHSAQELKRIAGLGRKSLNEVKEYLGEKGVVLAGEATEDTPKEITKLMICSVINGYMVAIGSDYTVFRNPRCVRVFETNGSLLKWIEENLSHLDNEDE